MLQFVVSSQTALLSDVLLHSEQVVPLSEGANAHPLQPGHVKSQVHPRGDVHRRSAQQEGTGIYCIYIVERVLLKGDRIISRCTIIIAIHGTIMCLYLYYNIC